MSYKILPTINASLNALAFVFLFIGWRMIKTGKREAHQRWMTNALICSALFLTCYLTYHWLAQGIVTKYHGQGLSRVVYFFILGTHTPLAMLIVPFCLMSFWYALKGKYDKHVRITKWLLPVWMYVSVTGVLIYLMLYVLKP